jgi:zinc/manganese transport system permease protein
VLAATAGILLLAGNPHGGEHLKELLVGQILWVNYEQLWPVALVNGIILLAWYSFRERLSGFGFYALFAFTVTASVQLVGIYLVFACLIIPALATRSIASRGLRNFCGYAIGAAGCCAGLMISVAHDFPSGAVMVWTLTIAAWLFAVFVVPAISRRSTSG